MRHVARGLLGWMLCAGCRGDADAAAVLPDAAPPAYVREVVNGVSFATRVMTHVDDTEAQRTRFRNAPKTPTFGFDLHSAGGMSGRQGQIRWYHFYCGAEPRPHARFVSNRITLGADATTECDGGPVQLNVYVTLIDGLPAGRYRVFVPEPGGEREMLLEVPR